MTLLQGWNDYERQAVMDHGHESGVQLLATCFRMGLIALLSRAGLCYGSRTMMIIERSTCMTLSNR